MIFYPILLPGGGESNTNLICPTWVEIYGFIALCAVIFGLATFALSVLFEVNFDIESDFLFKLGASLLLIGVVLLLSWVPLIIIFGVEV